MTTSRLRTWLPLLAVLAIPAEASAQMFGTRTVGRPITRPSQRSVGGQTLQSDNVGQIRGTERFLRGNRSQRDFVGSDVRERASFVGIQSAEATGRAISAVRDLRPQREVNINQAMRRPTARQMYNPRLRVGFDYATPTNQNVSEQLQLQLQQTETLRLAGPIEVSVAGGTATLRGTVASARDREMAAILARFEPGISAVRNELVVQSPAPAVPPPAPLEPLPTPGPTR